MRRLSFALALAAACGGSPSPAEGPARPRASSSPRGAPPEPVDVASQTDAGAPAVPPTPAVDPSAPSDAETRADVRAANGFALKLYARAKKAPGNVMLSGTSLRRALAAAYLGARSETAREMAQVLELPPDGPKVVTLARAEAAAWEQARGKSGRASLVVADRVWTDKAFLPKADFTQALAGMFGGGGLEQVDFAQAPDDARRAINGWVREHTDEKIVDLLAPGSVDKRTRAVITNAIYFKGRWALPFAKSGTKDEPFRAAARTSTVPMMHASGTYRVAQAGGVKALEARYEGTELAMLIVLPDDVAGLAKVEALLTPDLLDTWTSKLATARVSLAMPRFVFTSGGPMTEALQALGMKTAFGAAADFSGMADPQGAERLGLSQVVQQTWVAVDEAGTEAAAATGVLMHATSLTMGPVVEFKADHPFLFFVRDTKSGRILFVGRLAEPKP